MNLAFPLFASLRLGVLASWREFSSLNPPKARQSHVNEQNKPVNPYRQFVADFANLLHKGETLPLGGIAPHGKPVSNSNGPVALIFSPHPDDECIIGGLALRLMRESQFRVINIAVTLGSNPQRKSPRWEELQKACQWLGFELESVAPNGLDKINLDCRTNHPDQWALSVHAIAKKITEHRPQIIFLPHVLDSNSTHVGTHYLLMDALKTMPADFECIIVETEFWGQMPKPNLMVEVSPEDLGDLMAALSFHVGEVQRNPYHIGLSSWMRDNVRRGAESVGVQGGAAPKFLFATLYRLNRWKKGQLEPVFEGGKVIGNSKDLLKVFQSFTDAQETA